MTEPANYLDKSIEQIENVYWNDQKEYVSRLAEKCHALRKIKIRDLQIRQMITLLIQDIGAAWLMPIVLEKMRANILEEDEEDGSCFLNSVEFFSEAIWERNPEYRTALLQILRDKEEEITDSWGWKRYERFLGKMEG